MFHIRCGERVSLVNGNRTAIRNFTEFNYGLVLSSEPLVENQLFEVRIDKKINSWSGSIEIGVTALDPETMEFPSSATDLRDGSWIMSGNSILKDGRSVVDVYGIDLDKLTEGDQIGVMRTTEDELMFYINGVCQGVAAENLPERVFAIVDLYGKCAQVSIVDTEVAPDSERSESEMEINNDRAMMTSTTDLVANLNVNMNVEPLSHHTNQPAQPSHDNQSRLQFHERCGSLVKLSSNNRTAERRRPLDEFNNGVVMTHRPLKSNELFEIRIDRLVDKWSGSIEVGITAHNPTALEFPATMTNMRSGTTMMSGCGILTNGKGTRREYGEFNLDELREGDRIGMMRKTNGNLHYFINGLDQGVAATKVFGSVWGVVDLYGMTVKVTIVDRDEREEQNLITRRNTTLHQILHGLNDCPEEDFIDRLMFHPNCGTHAAVINNARTAHRPNAMDDFNNGVVLTNRPLKPNELFEVRLDKMVTKWAGSIEIGVTTHVPTKLEYPSTMTNVRSGTWMMTGNGVMHNGTTIIDEYGQNLDRLQVGDRVGVMRKESGTVHFFVNGTDQGAAAQNVPDKVYGVIDLYGQAAQATIVDTLDCYSPDTVNSSMSNTILYSDLRFHHVHGKNARVSNNGLTASRPRAFGEFNDAIVISSRALREGEMFEIVIEKMVDRWSGSIEAGVTAIRPEDLDFPGTMTDITHDTWMLSGAAVMMDGMTLRDGYACDLDLLTANTKVGMMRHADATLHFYIDGVDQGAACTGVPSHVYAVVDLYGQCAQVSIIPPGQAMHNAVSDVSQAHSLPHTSAHNQQAGTESVHRFSSCCGKNIVLGAGNTLATRVRNYSHALVFSSATLEPDEVFEVSIQERHAQWAGTLRIGVTAFQVNEHFPPSNLPSLINCLTPDTWFVSGNEVRKNGATLKVNYCPSLDWLVAGNRVGVKRAADGSLSFLLNGEDMGVAATNIPKRVFAVVDLYGSAVTLTVTSSRLASTPSASDAHVMAAMESSLRSSRLHDSLEMLLDTTPTQPNKMLGDPCAADSFSEYLESSKPPPWSEEAASSSLPPPQQPTTSHPPGEGGTEPLEFHENRGRNVQLGDDRLAATRVASYNQGLVMSARPLYRGQLFQVRIDSLNNRWVSSVMIGVTCLSPEKAHFPVTALGLKKQTWIVSSDCVFHNGIKMKGSYGPNLDNLQAYNIVGVLVDTESRLHLFVNGIDQGVAAVEIPSVCYAVVDLYGCCEQVTLLNSPEEVNQAIVQASLMQADNALSQTFDDLATQLESESLSEKADSECHEKEKQSETCSGSPSRVPRPFPRALNQEMTNSNSLNEEIQITHSRPSSQNQNHRSHQESQNPQIVNHELQNSNINQNITCQNQMSRVTNQQNQLSRSLNQAMINSRSFNEGLQNSRTSDVLNSSSLILSSTFANANTVLNTSIKQLSISNSNPNTPTQNSPTLAHTSSTNHISLDSNTIDNASVDSNTMSNQEEISNDFNMICNSNLPSNSVPISNDSNLTRNLNMISSENIDSNVPVISNKLTTSISNTQISNANYQVDSNTIPTSNDVTNAVPTISNASFTNCEPNTASISNTNNIPNKSSNCNVIFDESIPSANTIANLSIANKPPNSNVKSNDPLPNPTSNTLTNLSIANKPAAALPTNEPRTLLPSSNTLANLSIRSQHPGQQNTLHLNVNATSTPGTPSAPTTPVVISSCEYQAACTRFRHVLGLPDGFFMYEPVCHCDTCLKQRGPDLKPVGVGWCRFPLRRLPGADQVPDKWHLAFYGTRLADIRRILDHGELLLPGELGLERSILGLHKEKSKEDVSDGTQLYFYPSLQCPNISLPKKEEYVDPKTKRRYLAHAAFQILVQPGSYKVGPSSTDSQPADLGTEWVTKERGATALSALLVRLEAA